MTPQMILDRMAQMIRPGYVNARMPEKMRVKVTLPDTVGAPLITDWLPVLSPRASGDMQYDLPDIGDQVLCLFLAYGLEQGFVVGSMLQPLRRRKLRMKTAVSYRESQPKMPLSLSVRLEDSPTASAYGKQVPPVQNADKWHRTFRDGTTLEYDRAAHQLTANIKGSAVIRASGPLTLEAPIIYLRGTLVNTASDGAPGNAVISGGMQVLSGGISVPEGDVMASGVSLTSHTTDGVEPGAGTSSHPTGGSAESPGTGPVSPDGLTEDALWATEEFRLAILAENVAQNGSATDRLLLCLPEIAAAMAEKDVENRQSWLYLHDMFRKWLANPANPDAKADKHPLWVSWQWAISYFRAQAAYNEFTSHILQEGTIYSLRAMQSLAEILCKKGYLTEKEEEIVFDFTTSDWKDWEDLYYTLCKVPANFGQIIELDGLYIALGAFTLRALAAGTVKYLGNGKWELTLAKVSIFVHDTFNFASELVSVSNGLGFWSCSKKDGARKDPGLLYDPAYQFLTNADFRNFRSRFGMGRNFLVLSEPHSVENLKGIRYEFSCPK